jgi:hypothetical protein
MFLNGKKNKVQKNVLTFWGRSGELAVIKVTFDHAIEANQGELNAKNNHQNLLV